MRPLCVPRPRRWPTCANVGNNRFVEPKQTLADNSVTGRGGTWGCAHMDEEARAALEVLRRKFEIQDSPTVLLLWPAFEMAHAPGGAPIKKLRSWRDHAQRWRDHVSKFFGPLRAASVGPANVDEYRGKRLAAGAALATVNREIALVRRLLRFSARRGTIGASGLHGQGMTAELIWKESNVRTTVVEDNPAAAITMPDLLASADCRLRAYILLVHRSGMRRTEASLLRDDRVDELHGVAWVVDDDTKGGDAGRYVPLAPEVLEALHDVHRRKRNPYVFASRCGAGDPEHPDTWTHRFGKLVRRLGLDGPDGPPWLHDLRRSFITLSRRRGEDTTSIRKVSGHKTDSAFQRYNVFSLVDIMATKKRLEDGRAAELAEYARRGPHRVAPISIGFEKGRKDVS